MVGTIIIVDLLPCDENDYFSPSDCFMSGYYIEPSVLMIPTVRIAQLGFFTSWVKFSMKPGESGSLGPSGRAKSAYHANRSEGTV